MDARHSPLKPSSTVARCNRLRRVEGVRATTGAKKKKKKKGSEVHVAVDTLGNLLALKVTAADEQERTQVAKLTAKL